MDDHLSNVSEAFSRKALVYDDFGAGHANLERMRRKVRRHVLARLQPGSRLLEINAGTGLDAAFFARRGFRVHATDVSPGMVAQIEAKRLRQGLQDRLSVQRCSFSKLDQVQGGPYDYAFSNMGGVNCTADLPAVARGLDALLAPGAYVTWVVMPPVCLWELSHALRGRFRLAFRRLAPGGVLAHIEGVRFRTFYYTPARVRRAFGPAYRPVQLEGLSVFTPPADRKDFPARFPRLYRLLAGLDDRLSPLPLLRACGDFFILTLQKASDQ